MNVVYFNYITIVDWEENGAEETTVIVSFQGIHCRNAIDTDGDFATVPTITKGVFHQKLVIAVLGGNCTQAGGEQ